MIDINKLEKIKNTDDIIIDSLRDDAIKYLKSTDWYIIRSIETGIKIPKEVSIEREKSRIFLHKKTLN